ncbi:hypothetical protein [Aeromonas caviae]
MPTVGWIQETAADFFYERNQSSNAGGVNSVYPCRECGMTFSSLGEQALHERTHPVANPMLMIAGREVMGDNFKLTHVVTKKDVSLAFVDEVALNGCTLSETSELAYILSKAKTGFFDIELRRKGLRPTRVKVDLLIASKAQLSSVDEIFLRLFSCDDFNGNTIEQFSRETAKHDEVIWYRDGLVRYLHGVMAKDQRAEKLGFEEFARYFNRALQLLGQYPTSLSYSLRRLIKFSLNDFSSDGGTSLVPILDEALALFRGEGMRAKLLSDDTSYRLPIDIATSCILNDFVAHFTSHTLDSLQKSINPLNIERLSLQDRQKLHYLCYLKAVEENNLRSQRTYGKKLVYGEIFEVEVPELEGSDE